jgi:hypothetical protein
MLPLLISRRPLGVSIGQPCGIYFTTMASQGNSSISYRQHRNHLHAKWYTGNPFPNPSTFSGVFAKANDYCHSFSYRQDNGEDNPRTSKRHPVNLDLTA